MEAMGLEPTDLLTASQALYQLSYAPECEDGCYQGTVGRRARTYGARPLARSRGCAAVAAARSDVPDATCEGRGQMRRTRR